MNDNSKPRWFKRTWVVATAAGLIGIGIGAASMSNQDVTKTPEFRAVAAEQEDTASALSGTEEELEASQAEVAELQAEVAELQAKLTEVEGTIPAREQAVTAKEAQLKQREATLTASEKDVRKRSRLCLSDLLSEAGGRTHHQVEQPGWASHLDDYGFTDATPHPGNVLPRSLRSTRVVAFGSGEALRDSMGATSFGLKPLPMAPVGKNPHVRRACRYLTATHRSVTGVLDSYNSGVHLCGQGPESRV